MEWIEQKLNLLMLIFKSSFFSTAMLWLRH